MRIFIYLSFFVFIACRLSNSTEPEGTDIISNPMEPGVAGEEGVAMIRFVQNEIDLGLISQGERHDIVFEYENVGKIPLIISALNASCGCTLPRDWRKDPIKPGEKGTIEATFDSTTKSGDTQSEITLVANTLPSSTVLLIKANVITPNN